MAKTEEQISQEAYAIKAHIDAAEACLDCVAWTQTQRMQLRLAFREIGKAIIKAI